MLSVYDLKPRFQRLLRPMMAGLAAAGVRPNHVTIIAALGSLIAGIIVVRTGWLWIFPVWLLLRMALNAIDGMMAREFNLASDLGAILNEVGDVLSDFALYLPIAFLQPELRWPAFAFAVGGMMTEFCGVLGRALGASRRYDGPMGKSDRALLIGAIGLIGWVAPTTVGIWPQALWLSTAATVLTCINRLRGALKEIRQR